MKKTIGWIITILVSLILLLILSLIISIIYDFIVEKFAINQFYALITFIFITVILIFIFVFGIKLIRNKPKSNTIIEYKEQLELNVSGQVDYKSYLNLGFETNLKLIYFFAGCLIFAILIILIPTLNNYSIENIVFEASILIVISIAFPFLLLIKIKYLYKTNKYFHQPINYKITNELIQLEGETVSSIQKWSNFYKIKETKEFILLYTSISTATLLHKKMFKEEELTELKKFLKSLPIIKNLI